MSKRRSNKHRDDYDDYYDGYSYFPPSQPIRRDDGIQSRSKKGAFGKSWWAKRWLQVLESYGLGSRLQRGRSYARAGQVLDIQIMAGQVKAKVQGSTPRPYNVTMKLPVLKSEEWSLVLDTISQQAIFSAQLLNGEMPQEIEEAFTHAGIPLFPLRASDLVTNCSCPDMANPCKHIAAVYYLLGEQFDLDPFLLFTLRGQTREQVIEELRQRRASAVSGEGMTAPVLEKAPSLDEQLDSFWGTPPLETFVNISAPELETPVLRRLGTSPAGVESGLKQLYQTMTQYVLNKVFGD